MDKVYLLIMSNNDNQFRKVIAVFKSRDADKIDQAIADEMNKMCKKYLEDDNPCVIAESSIDKYIERHTSKYIFYIKEMEVID